MEHHTILANAIAYGLMTVISIVHGVIAKVITPDLVRWGKDMVQSFPNVMKP